MIEFMVGVVVGILVGYGFRAYIAASEVGKQIDEKIGRL